MSVLNPFKNPWFSMTSLTGVVEKVDFVPQYLGGLGIFNDDPVRTSCASRVLRRVSPCTPMSSLACVGSGRKARFRTIRWNTSSGSTRCVAAMI